MQFGRQNFRGDFEGVIGGRDAAIDGGVEQNFLNFLARDAIIERGAEMQAEFVFAIESNGHGERDKTACVARESRAGPDFSPGVARDEILKWRGEVGCGLHGAVNVVVAQDFAPDLYAFFVAFAVIH